MPQSVYNIGARTFTAGEALLANRRVGIKSGTTTVPPEVEYVDAGAAYIGLTMSNEAAGDPIAVQCSTYLVVAKEAFALGATLYGGDDGKVQDTSSGTAQFIALEAATAENDVVEAVMLQTASTTAATVSIADSGSFTAATTVEAALAEVYQHIKSTKAVIQIPMPTITDAGAALAAFSNGDSTVPGYCVTAKGLGIRWNNHATPGAVGTKVIVPPDADVTANMVLHILAAKTGATVGDATKFTVAAYNNDVGAAYDADSTFGGDTDAMVGDATAKNVQEVTLTLALANLTAYPAAMELTIKPKDGTLGTDDVIMLASWIEYKRKALTA